MIREFIMGLTILSGANDMPQTFTPEQHFPAHPLDGTFVVVQTFPDIDSIPVEQTRSEYFFPNQRIKLEYQGEVGSDWPGDYEYTMTLLPPLDPRMCRHPKWRYLCDEKNGRLVLSQESEFRDMIMSHERADSRRVNDIYDSILKKNGLKVGMYIYGLSFADASGTYQFFFRDWDTLVSHTYYSEYIDNSEGKKEKKIHDVIQILKRVKE